MNAGLGISLLLDEEFDARPAPPRPDFATLLATAREEARAEIEAEYAARASAAREALACACAALASTLAEALAAMDASLTQAAGALAGAMIAGIGAVLPSWQKRLERTATAEIATTLLAALGETVKPHLAVAPGDAAELRALLPAEIAIEPDAAMPAGALRLAWRNGRAVCDPARIWNDIETILTAALLPAPPATARDRPAEDAPTDSRTQ